MNAHNRLMSPENLNYAWIKTKNLYRMADGFVDAGEIAAFELDLEKRLFDIRRKFALGKYKLKKLRPLPRPKKLSAEQPINRQYYHVAIEDQVAWIALVNALGPKLDQLMVSWSYGNRLYRPAWYEKDEASVSTLEIGPYRHASGHLYRKFQHSWPLFRRHVALTARTMVLGGKNLNRSELDEADQRADIAAEHASLNYLMRDFWPEQNNESKNTNVFHASIDLKQFYPTLNVESVINGLAETDELEDPLIYDLVISMLDFKVDMTGMPETALDKVEPKFSEKFQGIPTGLFVSGFLANAAMHSIDKLVEKQVVSRRDIAHFRFVDDHTLIAYDFDALCDWIIYYEQLLKKQEIGPIVNVEKTDPPSLGEWISCFKTGLKNGAKPSALVDENAELYRKAKEDAQLDGKNPTKLMTKTLAQVSEIASVDINILDDDDLNERLQMLEWLLLANIPENEIRPDTRASFAAGQIASLVPLLIQETDGLVDASRAVALHKNRQPDAKRTTEADLSQYEIDRIQLESKLQEFTVQHDKDEAALLKRCFELLLQSLREHPGKARLFHRMHQYCQITGHKGLESISYWLNETRSSGKEVWADYYAALSLQIMANGLLRVVSQIRASDTMHSEVRAATSHLDDISKLDSAVFWVPSEREAWFHETNRNVFGVALIQAAEMIAELPGLEIIAKRLSTLSEIYIAVVPCEPGMKRLSNIGHGLGTWAHLAENILGNERVPSAAWMAFAKHFTFEQRLDLLAARRYPEHFPDGGWVQILSPGSASPENDSAWLSDVMRSSEYRLSTAQASGKLALKRAARSFISTSEEWITINEWTASVKAYSPFDPRRSEWSSLEITAQLLSHATTIGGDDSILKRLHPNNVLLPCNWINDASHDGKLSELSWNAWKNIIRDTDNTNGQCHAKLRTTSNSLVDYRYAVKSKPGSPISIDEQRLISVGRLLLGLLRNDHSAPRIWNIRGNQLIYPLPRTRWFESLAISSSTTNILEACLGARPAESRAITRAPGLFGWQDGKPLNDATFDSPPIYSTSDLLEAIRLSQKILEANQLTVSLNQPRQLIPFQIADFTESNENASVSDINGDVDDK